MRLRLRGRVRVGVRVRVRVRVRLRLRLRVRVRVRLRVRPTVIEGTPCLRRQRAFAALAADGHAPGAHAASAEVA